MILNVIIDCCRNVAEALVLKGLATVVRHGNNDDARSSCYDALKSAEEKASKSGKGVHTKDGKQLRVTEVSDATRAKTFLASLQRTGRVEGVVEFVSSGSRVRLYIPKENCLCTFLLAGKCQKHYSFWSGPDRSHASQTSSQIDSIFSGFQIIMII